MIRLIFSYHVLPWLAADPSLTSRQLLLSLILEHINSGATPKSLHISARDLSSRKLLLHGCFVDGVSSRTIRGLWWLCW